MGDCRFRFTDAQHRRLASAAKKLNRQTIKRILADHGIEPASTRRERMSWEAFLLIRDRDPLFTTEFRQILGSAGAKTFKLPARSPDLNAYAETIASSILDECLSPVTAFGERHLRWIVSEYVGHYHLERNYQGLGNELIEPPGRAGRGRVVCRERFGGLFRYYHQLAA